MNLIIMLSFLYSIPEGNYFVYQEKVPENIDFCVYAMHNPLIRHKFEEQWCDLEITNEYILSVKEGT